MYCQQKRVVRTFYVTSECMAPGTSSSTSHCLATMWLVLIAAKPAQWVLQICFIATQDKACLGLKDFLQEFPDTARLAPLLSGPLWRNTCLLFTCTAKGSLSGSRQQCDISTWACAMQVFPKFCLSCRGGAVGSVSLFSQVLQLIM